MTTPTFAAVGSYSGGNASDLTSFNLATSAIGNCFLMSVGTGSNSVKLERITSSNVIWKRIVPTVNDATIVVNVDLWLGVTVAVSNVAQTLTYSGPTTGIPGYAHIQEFTAGLGANTLWSVDGVNVSATDHATSTTLTFDPLTPSAGPRLFYAICWPALTNAVVGSTPGITYALSTDGLGRIQAYDLAAVGSRAPTATIGTTSRYVSLSVVLRAGLLRRPLYPANGSLTEIPDGDALPVAIIGANPIDVQIFTTSGTWTKPTGATLVKAICIGAGGGGGASRRGAAGTARGSGAGGGGGAYSMASFPASVLSSTETVTVGTAGAGAVVTSTDDTDGASGGNGGDSVFRASGGITGGGGGGGGGGTSAAGGAAGAAGAGHNAGGAGGAGSGGNSSAAGATISTQGATGGGSGAGINTSNSAGGTGGSGGPNNGTSLAAGAGSTVSGNPGGTGTSGPANQPYAGTGGGAPRAVVSGNSGAGGDGGSYGGGGGGAAGLSNTFTGGKGGDGAPGFVIVYTY